MIHVRAVARATRLFAELLPASVATAESCAVVPENELWPAERALIAGAAAVRRAEFATARVCARRALTALGGAVEPILRGPAREPVWPEGIVGSITHCSGFHAAAAASAGEFLAIGIDAEEDAPLPEGVLEEIALPGEWGRVAGSEVNLDRLLFSAKESLYKAWFPLTHEWLGFDEARVFVRSDGTFVARVLVDGPLESVAGRWLARDGLIVTALAIPAYRA
jgi:4'-phosphopantetheinyl transferase EntD